jgi:antitoxin component YwqK of YwqJK toxin-antitoxin module
MKTLFLLPILLLSLISCSSEEHSDLVEREGLYYEYLSDTPFTGDNIVYHDNGDLSHKCYFNNGEMQGECVSYWENGHLYMKGNYKNNKREGDWVSYWENGQLTYKGNYNGGKQEGKWVSYLSDGTVDEEWTGTFKNGERITD